MKKQSVFNPIASLLAAMCCVFAGSALAGSDGTWEWTESGSEATLVRYAGSAANVTIPATLGGKTVVAVADGAFDGKTQVTALTIPASVTSVGTSALVGCTELKSVTMPQCMCSGRASSFFKGFYQKIEHVTVQPGATTIGKAAFLYWSGLKTIDIPEGVTSIGETAFKMSGLESVRIPASVKQIDQGAFLSCYSLKSIGFFCAGATVARETFLNDEPDVVEVGNLSDFCRCSFAAFGSPMGNAKRLIVGGQEMADITIPSDIRALTKYSFRDALCLSSVTLPATVSSVEEYALANCTSMKSVIFQGNPPSAANFSFRYTGSAVRNEKSKGYFLSPNYAAWRAKVDANANYCRLPIRCLDSANLPFKIAGDGVGRTYAFGDVVTLRATGEISNYELEVVCTGWTGTGNVPASGTGNSVTITVLENSSIEWHYTTNVLHLATSGGVPYQWIADNFPTAKESQFEALMAQDADKDGLTNGEEYFAETNPNNKNSRKWRVTFDVGANGTAAAGSRLVQYAAMPSGAVTAPSITPKDGWIFDGWTGGNISAITADCTLTAHYRTLKADLHVDSITVPESAQSGDIVMIAWTVGNTGNPDWTRRMTQKVWLRSKADPSKEIVVSRTAWDCSIPRDGSQAFSTYWLVPAKHIAGEWEVLVETALDTGDEYGGDNTLVCPHKLTITEKPLPNLSVSSMTFPTTLTPGGTVSFSYVVANTGNGVAKAPWTETISLQKGSARQVLATFTAQNDLPAGETVTRTLELTIAELILMSGDVKFFVKADSADVLVEQDDDDTLEDAALLAKYAETPVTLTKRLYLTASTDSVLENYSGRIRYTLRRSGECNAPLVVSLSKSGASSSLSLLNSSVTIPSSTQGLTFYGSQPVDDSLVNGSRDVTVTFTAADADFAPVSHTLTILDNEVPKLFITLDRTSVREGGDAMKVTVRRELVTDQPLTVYLSGPTSAQCTYPASVVIAAGEESVTFDLLAKDDAAAEIATDVTLKATADGYTAGSVSYTVEDDDVPGVTLTLTPEEVSEDGDAKAVYAVLARTDTTKVSDAITVRLTPSVPGQLILRDEVTIPKGYLTAGFYIQPVDNAIVDGDRDIVIDGAIKIESCGCSGQPSSGDAIRAVLRIIDNDVPKLSLRAEPSTMKEGLDHAGDLILSHNSILDEDLVVNLSWDIDNEIDIPEQVTIPAGQSSVTIPVRTIDDGLTDGGQQVSVYADDPSQVFASGSTWVQVSDQNLPDLSVTDLTYDTALIAKEQFPVSFVVRNDGFATAKAMVKYEIHLVNGKSNTTYGDRTKVAGGTISTPLAIGATKEIAAVLTVPEMPGDYRVVVVIDSTDLVSELDEADNTTWGAVFTAGAAYTATVTAEKKVYLPNTPVSISGTAVNAKGGVAANVPVDVYVLRDGMRRTLPSVMTDANGAFTAEFVPLNAEAGRFQIGACYPGVGSSVQQDYFDILGMARSSSSTMKWDMSLGDVYVQNVVIRNLSGTPLTGLQLKMDGAPETCTITADYPDRIPANGSITVRLNVAAVGLSTANVFDTINFELSAVEGVSTKFATYFHCQSQKPYLRITSGNVNTTMSVGKTRYIDVVVRNDGKGDSGKITINLSSASWLSIVSGGTIDNLACGESATITLALTPTAADNLALNNPISVGTGLTVSAANGSSASISMSFTPVSESTGSVTVDAVDNNTYTLPDRPHLANASVRLTNPYTGATVRSGKTDANGLCTFSDVAEGKYNVTVTAANHDSAVETGLMIDPGADTRRTMFLKYELITATWEVVPTEIEEQYEVKLVMNYETSVPSPIIRIDTPSELPDLEEGDSRTYNMTLRNEGLIIAKNIQVKFPEIAGHSFKIAENGFDLAPGETKTVPFSFTRDRVMKLAAAPRLMASGSGTGGTVVTRQITKCVYKIDFEWVYPCGELYPEYAYIVPIRHGDCSTYTVREIVPDPDDPIEIKPIDPWTPDLSWIPGGGGGGGGVGKLRPSNEIKTVNKGCNINLSTQDCLDYKEGGIDDVPVIGDAKRLWKFGSLMFSKGATRVLKDSKIGKFLDEDRAAGELARDAYGEGNTKLEETGYEKMSRDEVEEYLRQDNGTLPGRFNINADGSISTLSDLNVSLYKDKQGNIAVSYAGSVQAGDWVQDGENLICQYTQQYDDAGRLATIIASNVKGGQEILLTGHSLGGGEATYASAVIARMGKNVKTRTFNAAGICSNILPSRDAIDKAAETSRNYRTATDPVSVPGYHIGEIITLDDPYSYVGHSADNFGWDGPPDFTATQVGLNAAGTVVIGGVGEAINLGTEVTGGSDKLNDAIAEHQYLVCMMEHEQDRRAEIEQLAVMNAAPVQAAQNAAPKMMALAAPPAPEATCELDRICEKLAAGTPVTELFSTGNADLNEGMRKLVMLDILKAANDCMMSAIFNGTLTGSVADNTFIARSYRNGRDYEAANAVPIGIGEFGNLSSNAVKAAKTYLVSLALSNGAFSETDYLATCPADTPPALYSALLDRVETLATVLTGDCTDETAAQWANFKEAANIIHTLLNEMYADDGSIPRYVKSAQASLSSYYADQANAVCASVSLQLSQTISMTREAFLGTLTMFNGNGLTAIKDLQMTLQITDADGEPANTLFTVDPGETSGGMSSGWILDGGLTVAPGSSGSAQMTFIPKPAAAPTVPKVYSFGGYLTYTDPFSGKPAKLDLVAVTLTVNPSPFLVLDYYVQRDVYADDPFTPGIVEASQPAEIAVRITNTGVGDAKNVTIATPQPHGVEIIENEKVLKAAFDLKDFPVETASLNGTTKGLSLTTANIGTIPGNTSAVAQWWLTSTIQGHFSGLDASVTAVNSWNTPDTALVDLDHVGTHKLVRSVVADGETLPAFLVNVADREGKPEEIHIANREPEDVEFAPSPVLVSGELLGASPVIVVSVTAPKAGWNYAYLKLPGLSRYTVKSVRRSNASEVSVRNVWITDRVFPDQADPVVEDRLHIADEFSVAKTETYTITLAAKPALPPEVVGFAGVTDGMREYQVRDTVSVLFSKEIDPASFTADAVMLWAGSRRIWDLSALRFESTDGSLTNFTISGLSNYCAEYTTYQLIVQAAEVTDLSGIPGESGKSVTWMLSQLDAPFPTVSGVPAYVREPVDNIAVTFTSVMNLDTLASNCVALAGVDLEDTVRFVPLDASNTRFTLTGLAAHQTADGRYELEFLDTIADIYGISLARTDPVVWTLDRVAPTFVSLETSFDANGKRVFTAVFSEPILAASVAGSPYAAYMTVSGETITVAGLDDLYLAEGEHSFTLDAAAFTDLAGNPVAGTASRTVTWTKDTVAPAAATEISISPDAGSSASDGITSSGEIVLKGTAGEPNLTVSVFVNGAAIPAVKVDLGDALKFEIPLSLSVSGAVSLKIRLADAAGNFKDTEYSVFVDTVALAVTVTGIPEEGEATDALTLTFSAAPNEAEALAVPFSLTCDGAAVDLSAAAIEKVSEKVYRVTGLTAATSAYGDYVFTYSAAGRVSKDSSGIVAASDATLAWTHLKIDKTPPSVTSVAFDGSLPMTEYVEMFSSVSVTFSEPVNVPALIESGLASAAFRIRLRDGEGSVTGAVNAVSVAWNADALTATATFDPTAIPVGDAVFSVEPYLVADEAGNLLVSTDGTTVPSVGTARPADPPASLPSVAANAMPTFYDYDGDGVQDLFVGEKVTATTGKVRYYHATEPGKFTLVGYLHDGNDEEIVFPATGCQGAHVSFGDIDGDGRPDMVFGLADGSTYVWRYTAGGPNARKSPTRWPEAIPEGFASARAVTACRDLDGDGRDEIVVGGEDGKFRVYRYSHSGDVRVEWLTGSDGEPLKVPNGRSSPAFHDLDGDGTDDLVSGDTDGNLVAFLGRDGVPAPADTLVLTLFADPPSNRSRPAFGDLDGDGRDELVVGTADGELRRFDLAAAAAPSVAFSRLRRISVEEALSNDLYWNDTTGWAALQEGNKATARTTVSTAAGSAVLTTTVRGAGQLDFTWSATGQGETSVFSCAVDGKVVLSRTGVFDLTPATTQITGAGEHVIVWTLAGKNTAILEAIEFTPSDPASQATSTTVVPVPYAEIRRRAPTIWKANAGDYEAAAKAVGANGLTVMDSYVAGLEPENPDSKFRAVIEYEDGEPKIGWQPDLSSEGRTYRTFGKATLDATEWTPVTDQNKADFRFFRVTVEMTK